MILRSFECGWELGKSPLQALIWERDFLPRLLKSQEPPPGHQSFGGHNWDPKRPSTLRRTGSTSRSPRRSRRFWLRETGRRSRPPENPICATAPTGIN